MDPFVRPPPAPCSAASPLRLHRRAWLATAGVWVVAQMLPTPAWATALELVLLKAFRTDQGVMLNFETHFELPAGVNEALQKGVALHFVATAEVVRSRWYWRDKRQTQASRSWRLAYQPLTLSYRVSLGGLSQTYRTLDEALRALQSSSHWRIGEAIPADDDGDYRVEFNYRLDTDQLPRPLQIGIGSQPEWNLRLDRTIGLQPESR